VTRFEVPLQVRGWAPFNFFFDVGWSIVKAFLMAGLAVLVVMFWPQRTARVARSAVSQPVPAFLLGLVTAIFGVTLIVVLAITICLSPVSLIGGIVLAAAVILGWVALGLEVGWRMAQSFKRDWHPATQAGVGTLVLSLVVYAVGMIPCLGPFLGAIVWLIGLGAVLLTRFGGQDSPPMTSLTSV
jgi:cytochrome c biogenesis protein CcdA